MRNLKPLFQNKPIFRSIFEKYIEIDREIRNNYNLNNKTIENEEFDRILQKFSIDELKKIIRILFAYRDGEISQITTEDFNRWYNRNYPEEAGKTSRKRYKKRFITAKKKAKNQKVKIKSLKYKKN